MYLNEANVIDDAVVNSPELLGKECCGCMRILAYNFFQRDSTFRDGRADLCDLCANAPRLSTSEHLCDQREKNYNAVAAQRWQHQEDYRNDSARIGRRMQCSDFVFVLHELVPNLYITDGRIAGDLAVFRTYGQPQPRLDGRDFEYLFYIPTGLLPEYSLYEFNERDIPVREKQRGWRTVLLRLIKSGLLTEETCNRVFGEAHGEAATVYLRHLHNFRNRTE